MERWIDVCALTELPGDRPLGRVVEGVSLALLRQGDRIAAVEDRCPHQTFPLSEGHWRDGRLVCALHHWSFPIFEPDPADVPPELRCRHYRVRVEDGRVQVDLES